MGIALITGASSGLGRAYAHELGRSPRVDGFWLVARRRDRLEKLAGRLHKPVRIIEADLLDPDDFSALVQRIDEEKPDVSYLVNAAGFCKFGYYDDVSQAGSDGMVDLNCRACVDLCVACIPHMARGSRILNVVSVAGFLPLPGLNVYAASKAFMLSYSRSLRWEVAGRGIVVTAVCPFWMKTEFMQVGEGTGSGRTTVKHFPLAQKPETVASRSLLANRIGFATATCGLPALVLRIFSKFLPNCVPMILWEGLRRI